MHHPMTLRNPIPRSTDDGAGGGGGDTTSSGGADTTTAGEGGADTAGGGAWSDGLPDDLKSSSLVQRSKDLTDALTAGIAAEKRLGVPANQLVRLPSKPEDREAVQAIYKALGAPESADGYKIDWEGATDDDKAVVTEFAAFMHEKGPFPPDALAAAAEFWRGKVVAETQAGAAAEAAARAAGEAELRTEWGGKFDQYKGEIGKLIVDMGGEALVKELSVDALGNSPALARMLAKVVDMRAEAGPTGDGQAADLGPKSLTPGQARVRIAEMEGDEAKYKALMDPMHPQHAAVVAERQALLLAANPSSAPKAS